MKQVSVTYKAPPGDSKVTEVFGHTFFDGKEETIDVDDRTLAKLQGNKNFKCGEPTDAADKPADPEKEKAEKERIEREEADKKAAQTPPGPGRGYVHPIEPEEEEGEGKPDETAHDPASEGQREAREEPSRTFLQT